MGKSLESVILITHSDGYCSYQSIFFFVVCRVLSNVGIHQHNSDLALLKRVLVYAVVSSSARNFCDGPNPFRCLSYPA